MKKFLTALCVLSVAAFAVAESQAQTQQFRIEVTSNAPAGGNAITPVWFGFHDGSFDVFDSGSAVSAGLEELAETGMPPMLSSEFGAATTNGVDVVVGSPTGPPPIQPGESATSAIFSLDASDNQFLSYASMLLPSNDYFLANDNPTQVDLSSIFGGGSISFNVGESIYDAGTEIDDFATAPGNPLFGIPAGDGGSGVGADQNGVASLITSTTPYANFLNSPPGFDFSQLNFNNTDLYPNGLATVTITAVPEPSSLGFMMLGLGGLFLRRRRS